MLPFIAALVLHNGAHAQQTFDYGGVTRTYYLDAPDPIPEGAPLVFVLHGYSSSAAVIRTYSGWGNLATSEGFVAVFPQGTPDEFGVPPLERQPGQQHHQRPRVFGRFGTAPSGNPWPQRRVHL